MAYQSRTRKRINALRRAPDGSAFQTCESCGDLVAIALVDMHECEPKKDVKRLKGEKGSLKSEVTEERFGDQPRSEFRFFMESFMKDCDTENLMEMDRKGFETWKNMSWQERLPYTLQADKVNNTYEQKLLKESEEQMFSWVDEEVDSAEVGKFDKTPGHHGCYDSGCSDCEPSESEQIYDEAGICNQSFSYW